MVGVLNSPTPPVTDGWLHIDWGAGAASGGLMSWNPTPHAQLGGRRKERPASASPEALENAS